MMEIDPRIKQEWIRNIREINSLPPDPGSAFRSGFTNQRSDPQHNNTDNLLDIDIKIMFVGHHQEPIFSNIRDRTNWRDYSKFGKRYHQLAKELLPRIFPEKFIRGEYQYPFEYRKITENGINQFPTFRKCRGYYIGNNNEATETFCEYFWNTNLIKTDDHVAINEKHFVHIDRWLDVLYYEIFQHIKPKIVVLFGKKLIEKTNIRRQLRMPPWRSRGRTVGIPYSVGIPHNEDAPYFIYSYSPCALNEWNRYIGELINGIVETVNAVRTESLPII